VALEDAGAVRWRPVAPGHPGSRARTALIGVSLVAALALLLPAALADGSAVVFRIAADRAWARDWSAATALYEMSQQLDPWHPAPPKALAVAADHAGDPATALIAARRATELIPGDDESWTNLAILCAANRDVGCAARAAEEAVAYAPTGGSVLVNAALVLDGLGDRAAADDAYRLSELVNLQTTLAFDWPRRVTPGDRIPAEIDRTTGELNLLIATRATGGTVQPARFSAPAVRALAYAMAGDRGDALATLATAQRTAPHEVLTWDISVLLLRHWNLDAARAERIDEALRGGSLPRGSTEPARLVWDVASFRPFPADGLVSGATRLLSPIPWPQAVEALLPSP
jgi:Flp pilus assembly protein TadD